MQRQSPPKHRHDGTSPLPLGMDWSPPPRNWVGRETVWPHDPHTGWSYCVTIPSWVMLAKSRDSDPVVFYRVLVGIQSPEGITTTRTILRRFNDFLKLHAALKRLFPKKSIPSTPPKGLLRMKTRAMLEERRTSLEEWITRSLSDIDLSRSMVVASFLELEVAARLSFQVDDKSGSDSHASVNASDLSPHSMVHMPGSSLMASENGSDTAYETSDIGSPSLGRDNISDVGTDPDLSFYDDLSSPADRFAKYGLSNIDESLSMGEAILEKLENFSMHKLKAKEIGSNFDHIVGNGSSSKASEYASEFPSKPTAQKSPRHFRKLSNESAGSERSSTVSNLIVPIANGHEPRQLRSDADVVRTGRNSGDSEYEFLDDMRMVLPVDQSQKVSRILTTLQQRLITAKTDMEDLTSRLNQETAVKEYLASKVKDLEVELETTKQKSKENLEQAILIERERTTQMQWEMEELKQKSLQMELKLKSEQAQMLGGHQSVDDSGYQQKDSKPESLLKQHQELEGKLKADIRVLVKEVKSLRSVQSDLKQQLSQLAKEKSEAEERLHEERKRDEDMQASWRKLVHECRLLHEQAMNSKGDAQLENTSSDFDFIRASDNKLGISVAKANEGVDRVDSDERSSHRVDDELRELLKSMLVDNVMLRKQVRSLQTNELLEKGEGGSRPGVDDVNDAV